MTHHLSQALNVAALEVETLVRESSDRGDTLSQIDSELRSMGATGRSWDFHHLISQIKDRLTQKDKRIVFLEEELRAREEQVQLLQLRLNPNAIERGDTVRIVHGWGPEWFSDGVCGIVKLINYSENTYLVHLLHEGHQTYWIDACYLEKTG